VSADRIVALQTLLARRPDDPRLRFGLALEYLGAGRTEEGVEELKRYLDAADDQGNAWGRLGAALRLLGREEEAKAAYGKGIEAAYRHGHPSMAAEFEELLEDWER
jgi:predicted Zn-dependent protease